MVGSWWAVDGGEARGALVGVRRQLAVLWTVRAGPRSLLAIALAAALGLGVEASTVRASAMAVESVSGVDAVPRLPADASFRDPLAVSGHVDLDVVLRPRDPVGLALLAAGVSTPGSSVYRRYLTRNEFAHEFGATSADIDSVDRTLRALGMIPGPASANRLVIPVSGTVGVVQRAFHVRLRHVSLARVPGAYSTSDVAVLPGGLAAKVQEIVGLSNVIRPQSFRGDSLRRARSSRGWVAGRVSRYRGRA